MHKLWWGVAFAFTLLSSCSSPPVPVGTQVTWWEDPQGLSGIDEVRLNAGKFHRSGRPTYSLGLRSGTIWLRFEADTRGQTSGWTFLLDTVQTDEIRAWLVEEGASWVEATVGGDGFPIDPDSPVLFGFSVQVPPGKVYTIYLACRSLNSLSVTPYWAPTSLIQHRDHARALYLGVFFGLLSMMVVYNAILVWRTRDPGYGAYAPYLASSVLFHLVYSGTLAIVVPWNNILDVPSTILMIWTGWTFLAVFNAWNPIVVRRWSFVLGVFLALVLGTLFVNKPLSLLMVNVSLLVCIGGVWIQAFRGLFQRKRTALLFLASWTPLAIGALAVAVTSLGGPISWPDAYLLLLCGASLEFLFLSLGLALRVESLGRQVVALSDSLSRQNKLMVPGVAITRLAHEVGNSHHALNLMLNLWGRERDRLIRQRKVVEEDDSGPGAERALLDEWEASSLRFHDQWTQPLRVIDDLLAKAKKGRFPRIDELEVMALSPWLTAYHLRQAPMAQLYTSSFKLQILSPGLTVRATPIVLEQVLGNLLKNAFEALEHRGSEVHLVARRRGDWVVLEVKDQGRGMTQATLEMVGRPFYTTKGAEGGTGLGLDFVRQAAVALGGSFEIASRDGVGTAARVVLPFSTAWKST